MHSRTRPPLLVEEVSARRLIGGKTQLPGNICTLPLPILRGAPGVAHGTLELLAHTFLAVLLAIYW